MDCQAYVCKTNGYVGLPVQRQQPSGFYFFCQGTQKLQQLQVFFPDHFPGEESSKLLPEGHIDSFLPLHWGEADPHFSVCRLFLNAPVFSMKSNFYMNLVPLNPEPLLTNSSQSKLTHSPPDFSPILINPLLLEVPDSTSRDHLWFYSRSCFPSCRHLDISFLY